MPLNLEHQISKSGLFQTNLKPESEQRKSIQEVQAEPQATNDDPPAETQQSSKVRNWIVDVWNTEFDIDFSWQFVHCMNMQQLKLMN